MALFVTSKSAPASGCLAEDTTRYLSEIATGRATDPVGFAGIGVIPGLTTAGPAGPIDVQASQPPSGRRTARVIERSSDSMHSGRDVRTVTRAPRNRPFSDITDSESLTATGGSGETVIVMPFGSGPNPTPTGSKAQAATAQGGAPGAVEGLRQFPIPGRSADDTLADFAPNTCSGGFEPGRSVFPSVLFGAARRTAA